MLDIIECGQLPYCSATAPYSPKRARIVERIPVHQEEVRRAAYPKPAGVGFTQQVSSLSLIHI